ncbi:MAG: tRNA-binding protein [Gemmatimonadota bacterium]|jgi:tRNA-binding protein|nr:tRNA-binding protein [Gemmatimonadota bacterium]
MTTIGWDDFEKVELRVGTVLKAELNIKARTPAYVLTIDLGEMGLRQSSAQITDLYTPESLIGQQVLCVCNFEPKRVAGIKSEVLVTGVRDAEGKVVLAGFNLPVPNGNRLF